MFSTEFPTFQSNLYLFQKYGGNLNAIQQITRQKMNKFISKNMIMIKGNWSLALELLDSFISSIMSSDRFQFI